jgi:hypothetical protein
VPFSVDPESEISSVQGKLEAQTRQRKPEPITLYAVRARNTPRPGSLINVAEGSNCQSPTPSIMRMSVESSLGF